MAKNNYSNESQAASKQDNQMSSLTNLEHELEEIIVDDDNFRVVREVEPPKALPKVMAAPAWVACKKDSETLRGTSPDPAKAFEKRSSCPTTSEVETIDIDSDDHVTCTKSRSMPNVVPFKEVSPAWESGGSTGSKTVTAAKGEDKIETIETIGAVRQSRVRRATWTEGKNGENARTSVVAVSARFSVAERQGPSSRSLARQDSRVSSRKSRSSRSLNTRPTQGTELTSSGEGNHQVNFLRPMSSRLNVLDITSGAEIEEIEDLGVAYLKPVLFRAWLRRIVAYSQKYSLPLVLGVTGALVWSNLDAESYHSIIDGEIISGAKIFGHNLTFHFIVNDIFMCLFFGLAIKEVAEALLPGGSLYPLRQAANPLLATLGGVLGPAAAYALAIVVLHAAGAFEGRLCYDDVAGRRLGGGGAAEQASGPKSQCSLWQLLRGWGIPTATDISLAWMFAVQLFGAGHAVINYLLLLAILDDALGMVIIAAFYGDPQNPPKPEWLLLPVAAALLSYVLRWLAVRWWSIYIVLCWPIAWVGLLKAHVHPALALVFVVPIMPAGHALEAEDGEEEWGWNLGATRASTEDNGRDNLRQSVSEDVLADPAAWEVEEIKDSSLKHENKAFKAGLEETSTACSSKPAEPDERVAEKSKIYPVVPSSNFDSGEQNGFCPVVPFPDAEHRLSLATTAAETHFQPGSDTDELEHKEDGVYHHASTLPLPGKLQESLDNVHVGGTSSLPELGKKEGRQSESSTAASPMPPPSSAPSNLPAAHTSSFSPSSLLSATPTGSATLLSAAVNRGASFGVLSRTTVMTRANLHEFAENIGLSTFDEKHQPMHEFEHVVKLPVDFGMFFFGLANAGVELGSVGSMTAAVLLALLIGKVVGISLMALLAVCFRAPLPEGVEMKDVVAVSSLGAIGLTVALFVSNQAFVEEDLKAEAKMGALLSVLYCGVGFVVRRFLT